METRKAEILKAASKLFRDKGYSAVTMRDLASSLGIKAASLYNHISSKQQILQEVIMSIAKEYTVGMHKINASSASSVNKLNAIVHLHVKLAADNPDGMSALNSDWMHLEENLEDYLKMREAYEANFRSIVEVGIKNKELKDVDIDIVVFSMLSTLRSLYLWIPKTQTDRNSHFAKNLADVLIQGINT